MKRYWYKFRVKYGKALDTGKNKKVSEEYLVDAESFTETEKRDLGLLTDNEPLLNKKSKLDDDFGMGKKKRLRVCDDEVTTILLILQKHYGCYKCVM